MKVNMYYLTIILSFIQQPDGLELNGEILINSCVKEFEESINRSLKYNITVQTALALQPTWSKEEEWNNGMDRAKNPLLHYTWTRKLTKIKIINGKEEIERNIDASKFRRTFPEYGDCFTLNPYDLMPGNYVISHQAVAKNPNDKLKPLSQRLGKCYLTLLGLPPEAIISGGSYRTVTTNEVAFVNGEESYNRNFKSRTNENLIYYWTCTQEKPSPNFCNKRPVSTESKFKIPSQFVQKNQKFTINLTVSSDLGDKSSAVQVIESLHSGANLHVSCEKNCPPVSFISNYRYVTYLRVKCTSNCRGIKPENYKWSVSKQNGNFNIDYKKNTQFGQTGTKFFVFKDVFEPGKYTVNVKLEDSDREGEAMFTLNFIEPPNIKSCDVSPEKGQSLITYFNFTCDQGDSFDNNLYELIARDNNDPSNEKVIVEGYYPYVFDDDFLLPTSSDHNFFIKVSLRDGPTVQIKIDPKVEEAEVPATTLEKIYSGGHDNVSIKTLIASDNATLRAKGIRNFQAMVDHLVTSKTGDKNVSDFVADLKYRATADILKAPVKTVNEIAQVSKAITTLMTHDQPSKSDPLLAKFSTTVCRKMVTKHFDMIKSQQYPLNFGHESNKISSTLQKCLETNTNPNENAIAAVDYNITTEISSLTDPVIVENYDHYQDFDEKVYKNYENYKQATHNILNATVLTAKVMAMTTAAGEKFVELFGNHSSTVVAKDTGEILYKSKIASQGVTLFPPVDFANDEHNYDILMSTWSKDILWWNRAKTEVATDIANIEFWHSTCKKKVTRFQEPARLIFTLKDKDFKITSAEDMFIVPNNYDDLSGEQLSRVIKVRRFLVPKKQTFRIHILDVSKLDALDIMITNFKFPTVEDLSNSTLNTSTGNNFFSFTNDEDYSIWCYVGILANKKFAKEKSLSFVSYKLNISATCCISWNELKSFWRPYCKTKSVTEEDIIECDCNQFSVIAGYLQNIESFAQEVLLPELELEIQSTYVVFITIFITYAIYCFMLIFAAFHKKDDIYFLGDNDRRDRFAYLIVTKTGGGRRSGTSSNVSIKLIGDKNSSDPHVLNYPDPQLNILQKFNRDMFIMTTKHHLGNLVKVELWFDCIGSSPDWFCEEIIVYDMQTYSRWYFKVKKYLAVVKGEAYVVLTPKTDKFSSKINFCGSYHLWCLWHSDVYLGYVTRLTVILSTILAFYVVALILYKIPTLQLEDGFDTEYNVDFWTVLVAFLCSFPVFLAHFVISWCLRFSEIGIAKPKFARFIWMLLIILICTNTTFLAVLGFWMPYNKSLLWLTASVIGILFSVFLYETIFALIQNFCCTLETKLNLKLKIHSFLRITEVQRQVLYRQFGETLLRPYLEHLYKPLDIPKIEEKRMIITHRRNVVAELEDLVMFFIYIIILYVVILSNKDSLIVLGKIEMEEVVSGIHSRTENYGDIGSIEDFYKYINNTLIVSMQPSRWYGNYVMTDPAMMIDATNKFIGTARFRQQRIKTNSCKIANELNFLGNSCFSEFAFYLADTKTFGYVTKVNPIYLKYYRLRDIWGYAPASKTGSLATVGEFATYAGGGYVAYLGRTLYNSYANYLQIFEKSWMDVQTRIVFIEFLTYNVNYNLFNSVTLRFERSASGYTFKDVRVYAARMLFIHSEVERSSVIFFVLFIIWVTLLFFKNSLGVLKKIRSFYKDIWLLTDLFIIIMSVTCIALFVVRMRMIKFYLKKLETIKHNEFLNYFYLFYLEDILTIFAAILVCAATIRLWKFLRFFVLFRVLENTLLISSRHLMTVTFCYISVAMAVAMVINVLYGNRFQNVDTVIRVLRVLVIMALRASDIQLRHFAGEKLAVFVITIYSIFLKVFLVIFISIILMSYAEAQMEFSSGIKEYNVKDYLEEKFTKLPRYMRYKYARLKAGQETRNKVEPKEEKFAMMNSFTINKSRMKTMEIITQCIIRNILRSKYFTEYDRSLMLKFCHIYLSIPQNEEVDIFFKGRIKGKRIALIDEMRIQKIAKITEMLLQEPLAQDLQKSAKEKGKYGQCVEYVKTKLNLLKKWNLLLKLLDSKIDNEFTL